VSDLNVTFQTDNGSVCAVHDTSFSISRGETVVLAGESGCGKSVTALSLMGLLPGNADITTGKLFFDDINLAAIGRSAWRDLRGNRLAMVFQDPMTALNPYLTVATQVTEVITEHTGRGKKQALKECIEILSIVGIPDAGRRIHEYPHQFSGGMRQKVLLATALLLKPDFLIADEPTTALDVTVQAQILELLDRYRQNHDMGILLITHDMGIAAELADRIMVMYAGTIVEKNSAGPFFSRPGHPYSRALLDSVPDTGPRTGQKLAAIPGAPPVLTEPPDHCPFAPRCGYSTDECLTGQPLLQRHGNSHFIACCNPLIRHDG
jgi:oligopeptide/dipeptide ABC transporter ATP-binding protein